MSNINKQSWHFEQKSDICYSKPGQSNFFCSWEVTRGILFWTHSVASVEHQPAAIWCKVRSGHTVVQYRWHSGLLELEINQQINFFEEWHYWKMYIYQLMRKKCKADFTVREINCSNISIGTTVSLEILEKYISLTVKSTGLFFFFFFCIICSTICCWSFTTESGSFISSRCSLQTKLLFLQISSNEKLKERPAIVLLLKRVTCRRWRPWNTLIKLNLLISLDTDVLYVLYGNRLASSFTHIISHSSSFPLRTLKLWVVFKRFAHQASDE